MVIDPSSFFSRNVLRGCPIALDQNHNRLVPNSLPRPGPELVFSLPYFHFCPIPLFYTFFLVMCRAEASELMQFVIIAYLREPNAVASRASRIWDVFVSCDFLVVGDRSTFFLRAARLNLWSPP